MLGELLSIDDAKLHLSIIRKIATRVGFRTTGASSVGEALNLLRANSFDCITLDLSLGERSGTEVLILLAELKSRTPVILISGSEDDASEEALSFG
jgi:CheY-like chemotaxis protein